MTPRYLWILAATCLIPSLARADLLNRYETGFETFSARFYAFYISRIPELKGNTPPVEWQEIDREIGRCVLATYESERGAAAAEAMVAGIEVLAATEISTKSGLDAAMAPLMTDDVANRAAESCGQIDRTNEIVSATRMLEIITSPANHALLNAD